MAAVHTLGIENRCHITMFVNANHTTAATQISEFLHHHLISGFFYRQVFIRHERRDIMGHNRSNEVFPMTSGRDGTRVVIGVSPSADNG